MERTNTNNHRSANFRGMRVLLPCVAATFAVLAVAQGADDTDHTQHANAVSAKLVEVVRQATEQFVDVNAAGGAGYQPAFGCISGPDHGAMGVHYINGMLVGDGEVDATKPEALIYEPTKQGMKLVGVEFIVDAATWMKTHNAPPMLEGQGFQFVNAPNRYGIPAFYELHVWAWRHNPNGAFVDWNNKVTCEHQ
jgi:hypothetical protein